MLLLYLDAINKYMTIKSIIFAMTTERVLLNEQKGAYRRGSEAASLRSAYACC